MFRFRLDHTAHVAHRRQLDVLCAHVVGAVLRPVAAGHVLVALVGMIALMPVARAEALADTAGHYVMDPSSTIAFSVAQVGGGGIEGRFPEFSGTFDINARDFTKSRVDFALRPGSIVTGQPRITNFLKSSAVFDAADFPVIRFRSFRIERTSANTAEIHGLLTARGKTLEATFTATLAGHKPGSIVFHVTGMVYRAPYGMDVGVPIYSNVVQFDMMLRGRRSHLAVADKPAKP